MRRLVKRAVSLFLVPLTRWYLRKERTYTYQGTTVKILPGVFHPGLFNSTTFLLDHLTGLDLKNKTLLELGCGTGLISLVAVKMGALVTATDLSRRAIENTGLNARSGRLPIRVIESDLFDNLASESFDWIIINPPYYARPVNGEADLAWNCGADFRYFRKLFETLASHIHSKTGVLMVLTLGCNQGEIFRIADSNGFRFKLIEEKNVLFDGKDFLYKIQKVSSSG